MPGSPLGTRSSEEGQCPIPKRIRVSQESVLVTQAAVTKYHSLVGLNNRPLLLSVPEAGTSKVKVQADSVSVEGSLFKLADGCLLTGVLTWSSLCVCVRRETESELALLS